MEKQQIKYTTDGKKVVVIGSLNSQEKIVQEVFIVNGNEIPSGENFVVKSLHDAPAISWKEAELKKIEDRYQDTKFKYDNELKVLNARYKTEKTELSEKASYLRKFINNASIESFDLLTDYLLGNIKYMYKPSDYSPAIIEFKDFRCNYDSSKLKLISFFGKDDGGLNFRVHQYSDGSGSSDLFIPCKSYDEAKDKFIEDVNKCKLISSYIVDEAKKHSIELPKDKINAYKESKIKEWQKRIDDVNKNIDSYKLEIEKINLL